MPGKPCILYVVLSFELELCVLQLIQMGKSEFWILNSEAEAALDHQIQNFLSPDILVESHHAWIHRIHLPIYSQKKEVWGFRMILNLTELNRFIVYHHFKMDNVESCVHLMKPIYFMASIERSDAYFSVPVDPSHKNTLEFYGKRDSISSLVLQKDSHVLLGYSLTFSNLCSRVYDV